MFFLFTGSNQISPADSRLLTEISPADLSDVALAKSDLADSRRLAENVMIPIASQGGMIWRLGLVWIS